MQVDYIVAPSLSPNWVKWLQSSRKGLKYNIAIKPLHPLSISFPILGKQTQKRKPPEGGFTFCNCVDILIWRFSIKSSTTDGSANVEVSPNAPKSSSAILRHDEAGKILFCRSRRAIRIFCAKKPPEGGF